MILSKVRATQLLLLALLVTLWELSNSAFGISKYLLVPLSQIITRMYTDLAFGSASLPGFPGALVQTLYEIGAAFGLAVAFGLILGFLFAFYRTVSEAYEPLILLWWSIPWVVIFPAIVLLAGVGDYTKILVGFLIGFPYILFNTSSAIRNVEADYITLARSIGHSTRATILKVVMPAAGPTILAGLRLGFATTFVGVIVAEILLGNSGIGYILEFTTTQLYTPELLGSILVVFTVGALLDWLFRMVESSTSRWKIA